ncbi:MAG TPA: PAS domain S-box protein, partial [Desulfuromonadaceae bacterium]
QIFSAIDVGKQGSIILRDEDLKIAVRYPELQGLGRIVGSKPTRELQGLVQMGRTAGTYQARAPLDNIERSYSFRKITGQPYYIIVGLAQDDYLSEWRKQAAQTAAFVALFCLATSFTAWLYYREWKRGHTTIMNLIQQEAKFHTIADYTYAWEFWLSPDGSLLYSSPSCERISGYTADEFCSDPGLLRSIVHPDDQKKYADHRHEAISDIGAHNLVLRICHADGTVRWLEHDCQPVFDQAGVFLGNRGSNRDVTDRKKMEAALAESEEHFHQLFIQNWDAVMLLHQETFDVVDANPAMLSLFGYSLTEMQHLGPWPLIVPDTDGKFMKLFRDSILQGEAFLEKGLSRCKDGTEIKVSAKTKLIRLKEQNLLYCSIRDISDRIRLEEEKAEAQSKLIHANKMTSLGMLVSGIAHEINNPNQYISLNASILAGIWKDASAVLSKYHQEHGEFLLKGLSFTQAQETVPRLLTGVTEGSARINLIVNNLKDFSRDNSKQLEATFDLNKTIQAAVQILTHHIHKHTYDFQVALGTDIPCVKGKAQQIEQVVINLITNALQALSDKTKTVRVATLYEKETDSIVLTVSDQGKGMTKEIMKRITEPFFSTRLEEGGTGLGLSISATILKDHDGTLEFESTPDFGTTATIKLQAAPANS